MVQDGQCHHLNYHQERLEDSFFKLFKHQAPYDLQTLLHPPHKDQTYRCRFIYDDNDFTIEYLPYTRTLREKYQLVEIDFNYPHKFLDRTEITDARASLPDDVESIFIKEGLLTDTSIANLACLIDGKWLTPKTPLLFGTTRARLIDEKKLSIADITLEDFKKATKLAFFNALTGFYEIQITHTE